MQSFVDELAQQAAQHNMNHNVNSRKSKAMVISPISKNPPQHLALSGVIVDQMDTFKLLGVHIFTDLKWTPHVDAISVKAASRTYFLKQLKCTGAPISDLLDFSTSIVCPIMNMRAQCSTLV